MIELRVTGYLAQGPGETHIITRTYQVERWLVQASTRTLCLYLDDTRFEAYADGQWLHIETVGALPKY